SRGCIRFLFFVGRFTACCVVLFFFVVILESRLGCRQRQAAGLVQCRCRRCGAFAFPHRLRVPRGVPELRSILEHRRPASSILRSSSLCRRARQGVSEDRAGATRPGTVTRAVTGPYFCVAGEAERLGLAVPRPCWASRIV